LQLMENKPQKFMTIQIIMLPLWSFTHTKMWFWRVSTHWGGSFDYDFTQLHMAISCRLHNTIFLLVLNTKEFEKKKQNPFWRDFWIQSSILSFQKSIITIWLRFLKITPNFIISLFKAYLITINNFEWNLIWIIQFINYLINWPIHFISRIHH